MVLKSNESEPVLADLTVTTASGVGVVPIPIWEAYTWYWATLCVPTPVPVATFVKVTGWLISGLDTEGVKLLEAHSYWLCMVGANPVNSLFKHIWYTLITAAVGHWAVIE